MTNTPFGNESPPQAPSPSGPQEKQKNTVGLIAMICGIVGFVFACIPGALIVGWVLLPVAFILGIVGVASSGKKKGTSITAIILSVVGTIVGAVVFFVLVGDAVDDAFEEDGLSASAERDTADGEKADNDEPEELDGSREAPLAIGETASSEEWEVTLGDPHEAGQEVADENPLNESPENDKEFWMVPAEIAYTGSDSGQAMLDISVEFVDAEGHTHNGSCGVIPDDLMDIGELYEGAEAEGNTCVEVPAGADGLWSVTTGFGDPLFFTAE